MSGRLSSVVLRLVTVLLVFVILATVGSFPSVISQTFTTITTVSTATNVVSTNVYSTQAVGATTVTVVSTVTLRNGTATIKNLGAQFCWYYRDNVTISPGTTEVRGTIGPPSVRSNFYIMDKAQFASFISYSSCSGGNKAIVSAEDLTSAYSLEWKNPSPGWYYLVFFRTEFGR